MEVNNPYLFRYFVHSNSRPWRADSTGVSSLTLSQSDCEISDAKRDAFSALRCPMYLARCLMSAVRIFEFGDTSSQYEISMRR